MLYCIAFSTVMYGIRLPTKFIIWGFTDCEGELCRVGMSTSGFKAPRELLYRLRDCPSSPWYEVAQDIWEEIGSARIVVLAMAPDGEDAKTWLAHNYFVYEKAVSESGWKTKKKFDHIYEKSILREKRVSRKDKRLLKNDPFHEFRTMVPKKKEFEDFSQDPSDW